MTEARPGGPRPLMVRPPRPRRSPGRGSPARAPSSSSVLVSGGAIRNVPPMPGSCTTFMCRPSSRQRRVTAAPSSSRPCLVVAVDDQLEALQQATAADVADDLVPVAELAAGRRAGTRPARRGPHVQLVALQHVEHGVADGGDQRVGHVRGEEQEAALVGASARSRRW